MIKLNNNFTLHTINAINAAGHSIKKRDGTFITSDDTAVQLIIDNYDPLPEEKLESTGLVNKAAGKARARYATDIPFQDRTYSLKEADARAFQAAGNPEELLADYKWINARANREGVTGAVAAAQIIAISDGWHSIMFAIEDARDLANANINKETDWQQCTVIADAVIAQIEKI